MFPDGAHSVWISIHSLRKEGDTKSNSDSSKPGDFNPLPPQGGRRRHTRLIKFSTIFQSTPSARRETAKLHNDKLKRLYQMHNFDKIGLFIYPHKPTKEPFDHIFLH